MLETGKTEKAMNSLKPLLFFYFLNTIHALACNNSPLTPWSSFEHFVPTISDKSIHVDEYTLRRLVLHWRDMANWQLLPSLCTLGITNMSGLFRNCAQMNEDLSGWDVSSVVDMEQMFYGATTFDHYLGNWDISNVTNFKNMFSFDSPFVLSAKNQFALLKLNLRRTIADWIPLAGAAMGHLTHLLF